MKKKKRLDHLTWDNRPTMTITVQDPPDLTVVIGLGYLVVLLLWLILLRRFNLIT